MKITGTILNNNFYNDNKNNKKWNKDLNEIEYFGGLECFIPLFKIIKYINNKIGENEIKIEEKENYINKAIKWIKDILKIIFKLICISKNNYIYFHKIIIPLICSFAEITHSIKILVSSKLISNNCLLNLLKDEIIYIFYIIIINYNVPFNIVNAFQKIFEIDSNWNNFNFSADSIIFDINKNKIIGLLWYISILFNIAFFILLYFDSSEKVPKQLIEHINKIYMNIHNKNEDDQNNQNFVIGFKPFFLLLNEIYLLKKEDAFLQFRNYKFLFDLNHFYYKFLINMIKVVLNVKKFSTINNICFKADSFINEINLLLMQLNFEIKDNSEENKKRINIIKNNFQYYYNETIFLNQIFPFIQIDYFKTENELLMNELIDYHGSYHHLMKEIFIFNRLWSNKKIFYYDSLNKRKESTLKYKNINYYTNNFQRSILYPILDYKNRYPKFSHYKVDEILYHNEIVDDYNFDFFCPELDKIIDDYLLDIYKDIETDIGIKKYNVCLIKQLYHVKGNLFVIEANKNLIIYFYSHPYDFNKKTENLLLCNKIQDNDKNNLCYGSPFKCPEKERNRKITIFLKDICMILKRIYYYRNSAIEIFNEVKSYYFNFFSEEDSDAFFSFIKSYFKKSYFFLNINNNLNGFIRLNSKFSKDNNLIKTNNLAELISFIINNSNDICIFDIIMLLNLLSNRSYIELNQYPVFPLLFFCDKQKALVPRDLKEFIGFQTKTPENKRRKELFEKSFNTSILDENNENAFYFNTHYSNIVYTTNFMIRLFPYSFLAIELQGDGFDDPNRLFFSIENTLFNIYSQKSDLRELIPEFFYLPEMFININNINFGKKTNNEIVDDVILPKIIVENYINDESNINITNSNIINNKEELDIELNENNDFIKYCIFVDYMKKQLESMKKNLVYWLNLIFGDEQKYKKNGKQIFRTESFFDIDRNTFENYTKNKIIMNSVEFGVIPLKIYNNKMLLALENLKNNYEKLDEETKIELNNIITIQKKHKKNNNKAINNNIKNNNNDNIVKTNKSFIYEYSGYKLANIKYWDEKLNINFKIDKFGKIKVYIENIVVNEIIDHKDEIKDIFYNPRLNMFATTSLDGKACVYIFPNKLFSIIKHPAKSYFDKVFLSSNPFPTVITFEKENNTFKSYSLSGLLIKEKQIIKDDSEIQIYPIFNASGGSIKDRIKVNNESYEYYKIFNLPFFDEFRK